MFVVEFFGEPVFNVPPGEADQEQSWAMFTHGICAARAGGARGLRFHRLAIRADQMAEPSLESLAERIEQAGSTLRYMSQELAARDSSSPAARQCLRASEILGQEQGPLTEALLGSYRSGKGPEQGAA